MPFASSAESETAGDMRSPLRPLPAAVERWTAAARALRWLDALVAWLAIWGAVAIAFTSAALVPLPVLAALSAALGATVRPLRARWRPMSGAVALVMSARLSAGDQAWYVRPGQAERVLVTARHRTRVVIVRLTDVGAEGLSVRRTRVLLVPADPAWRR
jgi:hypothetical protein